MAATYNQKLTVIGTDISKIKLHLLFGNIGLMCFGSSSDIPLPVSKGTHDEMSLLSERNTQFSVKQLTNGSRHRQSDLFTAISLLLRENGNVSEPLCKTTTPC